VKRLIFLAFFVMVGGFLALSPLGYSKAADAKQPEFLTRLTSSKPFDLQWGGRAPIREQHTRFNSQILEQSKAEWIMIYKGDRRDDPDFIIPTSSGGYLIGGNTASFTTTVRDIFFLEITSTGSIKQQKAYSGYGGLFVQGFDQTHDGKYVLTGSVQQITPSQLSEVFLLKVSPPNYTIETQAFIGDIGGSSGECGYSVLQTSDGKYIVTGLTSLGGGFGGKDIWLLKCSQNFNIESQQAYGGETWESDWLWGYRQPSIIQLSDGRYILAADTESYGAGGIDIWILEFDQNLNLISQQTIGGTEDDYVGRGPCVIETSDKRIMVAGTTESYGAGEADIWMLEFNQNLNLISQQTIGGEYIDNAQCIQPTNDGGFIVAGSTSSFNNNQSLDAYYFKLSPTLELEWEYSFGKEGYYEGAEYAVQTDDGRYVLTGAIKRHPQGYFDIFVLRVSADGNVLPESSWIRSTTSLVTDTFVSASETDTLKKYTDGISSNSNMISTSTDFIIEALYWNLNRPPIDLSLEVVENKSFLVSVIWHILTWSPDPYNSQFTIASYKIYRKEIDELGEDLEPYQEIGTIPGNSYEFADSEVEEDKKYEYVITSVASDGTESPPSEPIGN